MQLCPIKWGQAKLCNSTIRQSKQKICANLDHHWSKKMLLIITEAKKCSILCVQTNWVCPPEAQWFCKNDSESSLESLIANGVESSHAVKIVTRAESLTRVTLSLLWNKKRICGLTAKRQHSLLGVLNVKLTYMPSWKLYVQKSDFHLINVFCAGIRKNVIWLAQVVFSYFVHIRIKFAPHIYGVILHAHPVHGESHIQHNTNQEVATLAARLG